MKAETILCREITNGDISSIANYWMNAKADYLRGMGVDIKLLPDRKSLAAMLSHEISLPIESKNSFCLIWEKDGVPFGHCNTNPTTFGKEANFHVHIWVENMRKSGYGGELLKRSIAVFFNKLKLEKLIGEPYAENRGPNQLLSKLGFTRIKEYTTIPGSLSFEQKAIRWELNREQFHASQRSDMQ